MKHVPSLGAVVTAAIIAALGCVLLLGLQIILGLEYTSGGSFGTQASMIAAMVTLALLPIFVAVSRRFGAGGLISWSLALSFLALLFYSLPATTGRTGEIKEAKAATADDVKTWKSDLAELTKQINWAIPDKNAECVGAPDPLPPEGWPKCRRKTAAVMAFEERRTKLEDQIKAAGAAGAIGDMGSILWAWVLSKPVVFMGAADVEAATVRKVTVISFAVGLDCSIWALGALSEHLFALACTIWAARREAKAAAKAATVATETPATVPARPEPTVGQLAQLDFNIVDIDEARRLGIGGKPKDDNRGNGGNSGNRGGPNNGNGGGVRVLSRGEAMLDLTRRLASGETVPSQDVLAMAWGVDKSTVSKWLKKGREAGIVPAAQRVGRCNRMTADA